MSPGNPPQKKKNQKSSTVADYTPLGSRFRVVPLPPPPPPTAVTPLPLTIVLLSPLPTLSLRYVGLPLPSVEARLRDDETGDVLVTATGGDGAIEVFADGDELQGNLEVTGGCVFKEYWRNPAATAKEFTMDGWFKTGDVAAFSVELGSFRICGRASIDIIKSGGYKISALDIERVLLEHPGIEQAAVVGHPDETWGEVVAAALVWRCGTPAQETGREVRQLSTSFWAISHKVPAAQMPTLH